MIVLAALLFTAPPAMQAKPTPLPTLAPALVKSRMPSYTLKQTSIRVKTGQPFQLRLAANAGTGYSWEPQGPLPPGVTLLGAFRQRSSVLKPGAPGEDVLVFRARSVGKLHLIVQYVRPWERHARPAKVAAFTITVHE